MRLGEMLIRDGKLTQAQLDEGIATQAKIGGRLGTVLVEIGAIDVELLSRYLALELGVPAVTRRELDRARDAALRLLPRDLCTRVICLPFDVRDRHLLVAMRDPHDLEALDEIAEVAGRAPIPRVAPEIQIAYYLKEHYGVTPPRRVAALGERAAGRLGQQPVEESPTPRPLPGLPPPSRAPVAAPRAPIRMVSGPSSQTPPPAPPTPRPTTITPLATAAARPARSPDAPASGVTHIDAVKAAPGAAAAQGPATTAPAAAHAPAAAAHAPAAAAPAPATRAAPPMAPLSFLDAADLVHNAESRARIGDALLGYARGHYEVALLLLVRDDIAVGWRGFAPRVDPALLEAVLVPLGERSPLAEALSADGPMRVNPQGSAVMAHVRKLLKAEYHGEVVVAPIRIRDRVVNILYAYPKVEPSEDALTQLGELAAAAGEGYTRLIQSLKRHDGDAAGSSEA